MLYWVMDTTSLTRRIEDLKSQRSIMTSALETMQDSIELVDYVIARLSRKIQEQETGNNDPKTG